MGSMQWERQPSMQREDEADHGNGPGTNSSESAVNHLSKSVVRDTEGAAKQKPHATFCGNRGWATAPGDPVVHKADVSDMMRRLTKEELYRFDGTPLFPERRAYTASYELSPSEA